MRNIPTYNVDIYVPRYLISDQIEDYLYSTFKKLGKVYDVMITTEIKTVLIDNIIEENVIVSFKRTPKSPHNDNSLLLMLATDLAKSIVDKLELKELLVIDTYNTYLIESKK